MRIDHSSRISGVVGRPASRRFARSDAGLARLLLAPVLIVPAMLLAALVLAPRPASAAAQAAAPAGAQTANAQPAAQAGVVEDIWYVLLLQDQRAGHARHLVERTDAPGGEPDTITTTDVLELRIARGPTSQIQISIETRWVETEDGKPVSMLFSQGSPTGAVRTTYTFVEGFADVSTELPGGSKQTSRVPLPQGEWLPPYADAARARKLLEEGAAEIRSATLDGSFGLQRVETVRTGFEPTQIEVLGRVVPAIRCTTRTSLTPAITSTEFLSPQGVALKSEFNVGLFKLKLVQADRALALSPVAPPELMVQTLVKPDRPIERPRQTTRATYVVSIPAGDLKIVQAGSQTVRTIDATSVEVTVDAKGSSAPEPDLDRAAMLASTPMIACDDAAIVALRDKALAGAGDAKADRAERLRRAVYDAIDEKGLGVGFATASEVARTGEGDCTEHAVLLAALLRADGIPARVVSGLIYADEFIGQRGVFGYHMWAQALLPVGPDNAERWVDLDAVLPPGVAYDATHIAVSVSSLGPTDSVNPLVELAPLLGTLRVSVKNAE